MKRSSLFLSITLLGLLEILPLHLSVSAERLTIPGIRLRAQLDQPRKYKPVVKRESHAVAIVGQAVAALGGMQAVARSSSLSADGAVKIGDSTKPVHWETKNDAFRMETGPDIFASNGNTGWSKNNAGASRLRPHVWASTVVPIRLGIYLSEALKGALVTVQEAPDKSNEQVVALLVRDERSAFTHALCTRYWYFDRQSNLPIKVDFQERSLNSPSFYIWTTIAFDKFTASEGVYSPTQFTYKRLGLPPTVVTLTSFRAGLSIDDSQFAIPNGAAQ